MVKLNKLVKYFQLTLKSIKGALKITMNIIKLLKIKFNQLSPEQYTQVNILLGLDIEQWEMVEELHMTDNLIEQFTYLKSFTDGSEIK